MSFEVIAIKSQIGKLPAPRPTTIQLRYWPILA
jgi:hypothetical protein